MKQGSNRSCLMLQLILGNASCLSFLPLMFFSLFLNPHPLYWVSYSSLRAWDRVQLVGQIFERARTRVSGRSRAGVLVDLFRFQIPNFPRVSILMQWRDFFPVGGGIRSRALPRKCTEVVHSPPRPRCLGVTASSLFYVLIQKSMDGYHMQELSPLCRQSDFASAYYKLVGICYAFISLDKKKVATQFPLPPDNPGRQRITNFFSYSSISAMRGSPTSCSSCYSAPW